MSATPRRPISHRRSDRARPELDPPENRSSEVNLFGFVYYVLPQIVGLGPTLRRLQRGNAWWLGLGGLVEILSIAGEVVLLRGVFSRPGSRIGWRASYEITLAGGAATKVFATAGAGGVTLTVWAVRAAGLGEEEVATGMVCYEILDYGVYMAALAIVGLGLWLGVFAGHAPLGVTLIPAAFGAGVIALVLSLRVTDGPLERFLARRGWSVVAIRRCSGCWPRGDSISPHCGRCFAPSATRLLAGCS